MVNKEKSAKMKEIPALPLEKNGSVYIYVRNGDLDSNSVLSRP
jgi:hypothetical protein